MRVQFIGVGEAFDENLPNNSQILEWGSTRLLIDCGYAVPHSLWRLHPDPAYLKGIYISHRHADHYFGLPSYLVRLAEDGRKERIDILCAEGMKHVILEMIDFAYQGILKRLEFPIVFHEVTARKSIVYNGAKMNFAPSSHPVKNFAISVQADGKKYAYSGDGNFNERTKKLYANCSMLVHEAYSLEEEVPGHAKIPDLLSMAHEMGVQRIALTHLQRQIRRTRMKEIQELISRSKVQVLIPEVGEIYEI